MCGHMFSFLLNRFLRVEILGHTEVQPFKDTADCFTKRLYHFACQQQCMRVSGSPVLTTPVTLSDSGHPGGGALVPKSCLGLCDSITVAHRAPLSLGFPRQENWSGLPFPSPRDLPDPGIHPHSQCRGLGLISGQGTRSTVLRLRLIAAK